MMVLGDGEFTVQHHPVDEVGQLAQSAADAFVGAPLGDGESFFVAFALCGTSYHLPDREGLTRVNDESVDTFHCQCQVSGFVLLQPHIHITQSAADKRVVTIDEHRQR